MNTFPHIVSTRTLSSDKQIELQEAGWKFTSHDFISKIIHFPTDLSAQSIHKQVVLTSITAVKAFLQFAKQLSLNITDYSVYCISRGTNEYAVASGLLIKSTAPSASALADEILRNREVKEVTHFCSNLRRDELGEKLQREGVNVHEVIAYRTEFTPIEIKSPYDAIVFFSPSAVDSFLTTNQLRKVPCFCIGKTTADYAKQIGYPITHIAEAPSENFLIQKMISIFQNPVHDKE